MKIKLFGVRGSLPAPTGNKEYRQKLRNVLSLAIEQGINSDDQLNDFIKSLPEYLQYYYGGNTTCLTVASEKGNMYIVDCGSGFKDLGNELMESECGKGKGYLKILITHVHYDHIQGIPFFKPMYVPGNVLEFISPYKDLEQNLIEQMNEPFFPAAFHSTASEKKFRLLKEGITFEIEKGLFVDFYPLKHPGGNYAYRFREGGKTFIFATDAEFTGEMLEQTDSRIDFFMNADLLILDSQYTLDEHFSKFEWGHTSATTAVNCGLRWGVKHLVLTHHDPSNDDTKLRKILYNAVKHRNQMKVSKPVISLAREGMTFIV